MTSSRALGLAGSTTLLVGSLLSMVSGSILAAPHGSYFAENVTALVMGISAALLVRLRLFRWLIVTGVIAAVAFAHCLISITRSSLATPAGAFSSGSSIGEIAGSRLSDGMVTLLQTHLGWPVVLVGSMILIAAGLVSSRGFLDSPRADEDINPRAATETSSIMRELSEAPKWPLAYGAFLILCGILILFVGSDTSILRKLIGALITELGFAFFIAFVIGVSIEYRANVEHNKQISKGILSYIYGVNLDNDMFVNTEEFVFRTPVFRRDMTVSYDFLKEKDGMVLLKYTLSYLVENVSRHSIDYDVHTFVEQPANGADESSFSRIDIGLQSITIDGTALTKTQVQKARDRLPDNQDYRQSSYTIKMQPGEKRRVMSVHLVEKYARDTELWRSLVPCAGLTLIINWSEAFPLEVRAAPVHPSDKFDSLVRDRNSITASLYRPFFPHNGVFFWWSPARAPLDDQGKNGGAETSECVGGRSGGEATAGEADTFPGLSVEGEGAEGDALL